MHLDEINSQKRFSISCIYLWTNTINGKHYVGQAHNFYNRMCQYKIGKFNKYMKHAIEKYGLDAFDITILECNVPYSDLDSREQYWMDYYKSYDRDKGYNICHFASTTFGYRHTEESKQKMSLTTKEQYKDDEFRKKIQGKNNGMYGKHHNEQWCNEHSEWLKNRWESDEEYRQFWHDKMSGENNYFYGKHLYGELNGMYGKCHSEETRRKISEALKEHCVKVICVESNIVYDSLVDAAKSVNGKVCGISSVLHGRLKTYKGYHWERV